MSIEKTIERFNLGYKVADNGCWEWIKLTDKGYGYFTGLGERYAHRISATIHFGPLMKGVCVLHKCDNPPCVNPDHLFLGTKGDNNRDRAAKGRTVIFNSSKTHCKRGHEFNEKNTYIRSNGHRMCRQCVNQQQKVNYAEMRGDKFGTRKKRELISHCKNGHELTEENIGTTSRLGRVCKVCARKRNREYKARKKLVGVL